MIRNELQFIISCLAPQPAFEPDAFAEFDIDRFLYLLDCHRLTNITYRQLQSAPGVPATVRCRLKDQCVHKTFRQFFLVTELYRVQTLLRKHHVEAITLKGPILSQLYYGDCTVRECKDVDILVHPSDIQAAYTILTDSGYVLSDALWNSPKQEKIYHETFHHYDLYHPELKIQLELHWRLNVAHIADEPTIWANAVVHTVGSLPIRTLSATDTFMYLCMHGGMHQWKRLFWLLDIARIIEAEGDDFLLNTYQQAVAKGLARHILSACLLAHRLLGTQLPVQLHDAIRQDTTLEKLLQTSVFWINAVSEPYASPLESTRAFRLSIERFITANLSVFYLDGYLGLRALLRDFFVKPVYWKMFAFSDSFFALNYAAAPFLWVYSIYSKRDV